ncbi:MAG: hypothetical protein HY738_18770, partial [Bacteroidia bacterium]|nr:hypothetical protein [Bacteroidia bacterium]
MKPVKLLTLTSLLLVSANFVSAQINQDELQVTKLVADQTYFINPDSIKKALSNKQATIIPEYTQFEKVAIEGKSSVYKFDKAFEELNFKKEKGAKAGNKPPCDYNHPTTGVQGTYNGGCMENISCGSSSSYCDDGGSGNYSNSVNMIYQTFCPDAPGQCVQATFNDFSLENLTHPAGCYDWISVGNGPTQNSTVLWQGCGDPADITTINGSYSNPLVSTDASGCLTFRFKSDGTINESGWNITLQCVACAGSQTTSTGAYDCVNAIPICQDVSYSGSSIGPGLSGDGCSGCQISENYATWYYFNVQTGGTMSLTIDPVDNNDDYDFAVYQANSCGSLGTPVRCSYAANTGNTGMVNGAGDNSEDVNGNGWVEDLNVSAGQNYYLLVNNWTAAGNGFTLDWTLGGGAAMNCTIVCPVLSIASTNVSCFGGNNGTATVTITSGAAPNFNYAWSNGSSTNNTSSTSNTITNLVAGTYTVTVTNITGGCSTTASVTVTQPPALTISMSKTNVTCNGGNNGTATATPAGGTPAYTYLWSNAQTTQTATTLTAGTWTVTVTDALGCTKTASVTITQPAAIVLTMSNIATTCGLNNGSATVSISSGGVSPFDYQWSNGSATMNTASTSNTISSLASGTYTVTVTDNNNCTAIGSTTVAASTPVVAGFTYNGNQCLTGNSFNFTNTSTGATSYSWTFTGGTPATSTATNPSGVTFATSGLHAVTLTAINGACNNTTTINVTVFPQPTVTMTQTNVTCNGLCNGTATATPASGTVPYTYIWNDPAPVQTTQTATSLCAGSYNVTVTDANLCTGIGTVTITQPGAIVLNASKTNILCFGLCTGTA